MAGTKIKLKDQLGRVVRVGGDTTGATVGKDLRWPDGSLVKASDVRNPSAETRSTGGIAATVWKLIREVPANIQKLAKLVGAGFTTRGPDGEWYQRSIEAGDGIDVVDGDGVAGNPTIGLADLPDAGGGALKKIVRDAKGRVSGTSSPTTDDLPEGATNLYYTDERAAAASPVQSVNGQDGDVELLGIQYYRGPGLPTGGSYADGDRAFNETNGREYTFVNGAWLAMDGADLLGLHLAVYLADGSSGAIELTSEYKIPAYLADGTRSDIALQA